MLFVNSAKVIDKIMLKKLGDDLECMINKSKNATPSVVKKNPYHNRGLLTFGLVGGARIAGGKRWTPPHNRDYTLSMQLGISGAFPAYYSVLAASRIAVYILISRGAVSYSARSPTRTVSFTV